LKNILAFLRLIRAANLALLALGISLFYFLILVPVHKDKLGTTLLPFTDIEFALFVLSILLVVSAGSIIYDYYALETDREFDAGRPLVHGPFTLDTALYLHAACAFAGLGIGFYLGYRAGNFKIGYIYVVGVLLLYLYAAYLKKIPLAGNLVVAALAGFVPLLLMLFEVTFLNTISFEGAGYALDILLWQIKFYGGFAFLITLAREMIKDIERREGDESHDILTFAVHYGDTAARTLASIVLLSLLAGAAFFIQVFMRSHAVKEVAYMSMAVVIPVGVCIIWLWVAKEKRQYARITLLLKVVMLLGILSIPAFYLFNK
jgi:4-hydroxybenzoate polyprenyltransferase